MADLSKDALLFAKELRRMCNFHEENCSECALETLGICVFGSTQTSGDADRQILESVQKFHDKHPPKTYVQDFLEKFPNCAMKIDSVVKKPKPCVCRQQIYNKGRGECAKYSSCYFCWNETIED